MDLSYDLIYNQDNAVLNFVRTVINEVAPENSFTESHIHTQILL